MEEVKTMQIFNRSSRNFLVAPEDTVGKDANKNGVVGPNGVTEVTDACGKKLVKNYPKEIMIFKGLADQKKTDELVNQIGALNAKIVILEKQFQNADSAAQAGNDKVAEQLQEIAKLMAANKTLEDEKAALQLEIEELKKPQE